MGTWTRWFVASSAAALFLFGCGDSDNGITFSNPADGGAAGLGSGGDSAKGGGAGSSVAGGSLGGAGGSLGGAGGSSRGSGGSSGGSGGSAGATGGAIGLGQPGRRSAVVSGGARLVSTSFQLIVTIGEPPSGNAVLASPSFTLQTGIVSQ